MNGHRATLRAILPAACAALLTLFSPVASTPSQTIAYQGRALDSDGRPVADSTYLMEFSIYADSTGGEPCWSESRLVTTSDGLFHHLLGSVSPFPADLFQSADRLYLEIRMQEETLLPRTPLSAVPFAISSGGLKVTDSSDTPAVVAYGEDHRLVIYGLGGEEKIILQDSQGDSAVMLPDSSINTDEILNEAGIAVNTNINVIPLVTGEMTDLATVDITIPDDGYIVLYGKCYLLLSGTTGPNSAIVQIDENEGGGTQFPYYAIGGLSGYVNSGANYFPVFVTRVYYRPAGTYTFRLEGRASHPLPAQAESWDHVLIAEYYPTSYEAVKIITADPLGHPGAVPVNVDRAGNGRTKGPYYKIDLRYFEQEAKQGTKPRRGPEDTTDLIRPADE